MNVRQLEIFRTIMRDGTITAAANSLGVSQPAVSKLLLQLEDQLGYALFERIGGRLVPTMEAHLLFSDADRVFRQMEALKTLARDVGANKIGLLRIGTSLPLAYSVLPPALGDFRSRHPEVKIHLHTLPKREIAEALTIGDVDVAVTLSAILAPSVRVEALGDTPMVAVLREGDPLAAHEVITPELLEGVPLISYGSHAEEVGPALDEAFASRGLNRDVAIQIASSVGALPLVRQGLGVAVVDGLAVLQGGEGIVARRFEPVVTTRVSISINEQRPKSRFISAFLQSLRRSFAAAKDCTAPRR